MTTSFLVSLSKRALIPSCEPTLMPSSTSNHLPQAPPSITSASRWSFNIFSGETLPLQPGSLYRGAFQGQPALPHRSPELSWSPLLPPRLWPLEGEQALWALHRLQQHQESEEGGVASSCHWRAALGRPSCQDSVLEKYFRHGERCSSET